MAFLRTAYKGLLTLWLVLLALGSGSLGLCAFRGLQSMKDAPAVFLVFFAIGLLLALGGLYGVVIRLRKLWLVAEPASHSSTDDA
ncbi:hypothetical protein [Roseateles sp. BYS87W]|uniref:DUF1049 domain-containing protein n=1 Tax=Pelomonas baiyunensis TaxID=3299026 RepID=A0ABW7H1W9_9BURK